MFNYLKNLFKSKNNTKDIFWLNIRCLGCGNIFEITIDPATDLIRGYSENEPAYRLHKETVDENCYATIIIDISYDSSYNPISKNIQGAEFIDKE